jgi:hypothetical protein
MDRRPPSSLSDILALWVLVLFGLALCRLTQCASKHVETAYLAERATHLV